jgi:SAM-dependent methyltransferase
MYEPFADAFDAHARHSAYNALYDRPAMLALLGDVSNLDVLDAGCGPGFYAEALVRAGARVTGFDASPRMIELARDKVGDAARLRVADLEQPLDWLADGSFDLVVLALVVHHLDGRVETLKELRRVLRPGGRLVLSTVHPMDDWRRLGGAYFDRGPVSEEWNDGWAVRFWRQPLGAWCEEFRSAGFLIERVIEPLPDPAMHSVDPDTFERLSQAPAFIAFSLLAR